LFSKANGLIYPLTMCLLVRQSFDYIFVALLINNPRLRYGPYGQQRPPSQVVQHLTRNLPLVGIGLSVPPDIRAAPRHAKSLALGADAVLGYMVTHEHVLHFRHFTKRAVAFFEMANSSLSLANWRFRLAFSITSSFSVSLRLA